ncbi:MAG: 8-amino-7-oxononanoate synthase [bacterium]
MNPLHFLSEELETIKKNRLFRTMQRIEGMQKPVVKIHGREVILMCSNNYLGLANHPELIKAVISATRTYGVSAGASRLISGNMTPHEQLEHDIARFKKTPSALVFNSGYHANVGIISAIANKDTIILSDELNHASIIDGIRLSKAQVYIYRHRDPNMLEDLLRSIDRRHKKHRKLIVTDSVFSMDGDIAPLKELSMLAQRYNAIMMIDEAHATGVLGKNGRGAAEMFGLSKKIHIQMGTLGKALGSFGAYVAGSRMLIDYLINRSRSFIFTTALPPAVCAAGSKAIEIVQKHPELRQRLHDNITFLRQGLKALGFDVSDDPTPIIPLIIGDADKTMKVSSLLFKKGIFVSGIRPPSVPEGTSRLRLTVTAAHTRDMLEQVIDAMRTVNPKNGFVK